MYDQDAREMVNPLTNFYIFFILLWIMSILLSVALFKSYLTIELGESQTEAYPLKHDCNCPYQKPGSVDCAIYAISLYIRFSKARALSP